jgi:alpha-beta hydrolase superfamily lysophospholipase
MRIIAALLLLCAGTQAAADSQEVRFDAVDGVTVFGDLYRATGKGDDAPLILLFHQGGGDARGEYLPLVDRLLGAGYHALAIDQRRGGDRFGSVNRTASAFGDQDISYCDAYPDLEAALSFADKSGFSGPRIVWGSSYSAALVIKLAAEHAGDIDAVLAFSPASGDAMSGCRPEAYAAVLEQPLLVLRPIGEMEVPSVPPQMQTFREQGHQTYVADPGVHGSSMLNAERVGADTAETWAVVMRFIAAAVAH